jgi:hypothetical protein
MDAVLLRKMAWKSKFNFGKHNGLTVQEVVNLKKNTYIRWIYFNLDGITFMDEILDHVRIPPEFRIEKPGKEPEKQQELFLHLSTYRSGLKRHITRVRSKKRMRARYTNYVASNKVSKAELQSKNHGHK